MPVLIAALIGALANVTKSLVGRVLLALGLQLVTYTGFEALISNVTSLVSANLTGGLPTIAGQIASMFRVGEVVSILSGAVLTSVSIKGIRNGSLTKLVHQ